MKFKLNPYQEEKREKELIWELVQEGSEIALRVKDAKDANGEWWYVFSVSEIDGKGRCHECLPRKIGLALDENGKLITHN